MNRMKLYTKPNVRPKGTLALEECSRSSRVSPVLFQRECDLNFSEACRNLMTVEKINFKIKGSICLLPIVINILSYLIEGSFKLQCNIRWGVKQWGKISDYITDTLRYVWY